MIAGLRGAIPLSADSGNGLVTFAELARFAEREMAFNDGQLADISSPTNGFDPGFVLASGMRRVASAGRRIRRSQMDRMARGIPAASRKWTAAGSGFCWAGYNESESGWIADSNIRPLVPKQLAAGTRVEVEWQGSWYPAEVLTGRWGMHLVHYDDFEPVWDEWVSPRRIRLAVGPVA